MANRFNNLWHRFTSHRPSITRRRPPIITLPTEVNAAGQASGSDDIRAHLAPILPGPRQRPWAWGLALLTHLLVIAAVLLIRFKPQQIPLQSPPGINIEFDSGGSGARTTVPPKTETGTPQKAQSTPLPVPPPAPPQAVTTPPTAPPVVTPPIKPPVTPPIMQDEVRMPDIPLSALPNPPSPPKPRETHAPVPRPSHKQEQKYVFLNGMSYGNVSPAAQPAPSTSHGMNFSPPASDAQAATASDFSVKGDAGSGWDAALAQWVQKHAYYPQAAIEQNQQGTATVEFTVDRRGHVTGIRLLDSSGSPFLDQAWFQLFADNTLPPFPPNATSNHVVVRYTVHYKIIP